MNGFESLADGYKKYLDTHPTDPNADDMRARVRVLEFMATCTDNDICRIYDTSAFNSITKNICKKAMQNVGIDPEQIQSVIDEIRYLHDTAGASQFYE